MPESRVGRITAKIMAVKYERLPHLIAGLEFAKSLAQSRLNNEAKTVVAPEPELVLLAVADAAALVNLQPVALRRSKRFRSARRALGPRTLRYDRATLLKIAGRS